MTCARICPPCGVCRQVMREFCKDEFLIYLGKQTPEGEISYRTMTLGQLYRKVLDRIIYKMSQRGYPYGKRNVPKKGGNVWLITQKGLANSIIPESDRKTLKICDPAGRSQALCQDR